MAEILKPIKRTFWKVTSTGINHSGFTETDQVTTAPNTYTLTSNVSATGLYPALPTSGALKAGEVYSYNGGMVVVVQDHTRTIYAPEETPALFNVYRANTEGTEWIANEKVIAGDTRTDNGKTYICIQSHTTQSGWLPSKTPALWKAWIDPIATVEWRTGVAYKVNDIVTYQGKTYKCLQAHTSISTWNPVAAASLWLLV